MRILVPLTFTTDGGGLHENVGASVRHLISRAFEVVVVCPPGPFADEVRTWGGQVVETDYARIPRLIERIAKFAPFDLIHAHPGPSRKVALHLNAKFGTPVVLTIHGRWLNSVGSYHQRLSRIYAVSEAVRDAILKVAPGAASNVELMRNATKVDSANLNRPFRSDRFSVLVASRFDPYKRTVTDYLLDLWNKQAEKCDASIEWQVAGTGSDLDELKECARQLAQRLGKSVVTFHGWLNQAQLSALYPSATAALCPGRSAIEAMGAGLPTIALGSQGCFGLVDVDRFEQAKHCNFGGFGLDVQVAPNEVLDDLASLRTDPGRRDALSAKSRAFIKSHFDQRFWNEALWRSYRDVLLLNAQSSI